MTWFLETLARSPRWCWIFLLLFVFLGMVKDVVYTFEQGGIDFRNRLIGARLLLADKDPYWYKWKPGDSLRWADPREPVELPTNRNTVAPTCLLLFAPFAPLPHLQARILWSICQWIIYLGSAFLLIVKAREESDRDVLLFLVLVATIGEAWREHVERGQLYILFAFLLLLSYRIMKCGAIGMSGFVFGLLVSLRPTLIVVLLPFAGSRHWRFLIGTFGGTIGGIAASFCVADLNDWTSYFTAMDEICRVYIAGGHNTLPIGETRADMPDTIEGCKNIAAAATFNVPETGFARIARALRAPHGKLILQIAMLAYVAYVAFQIRGIWKRPITPGIAFFAGSVIALSAELFLPIHRGAYTNIVWLVPAGLVILEVGATRVFCSPWIWLLMLGLSLSLALVPMARADFLAIGDLCLLGYFTGFVFELMGPSPTPGLSTRADSAQGT